MSENNFEQENAVFDELMVESQKLIKENPALVDYEFSKNEQDAIDLGIATGLQIAFVWWGEFLKKEDEKIDEMEKRFEEGT